MEKKILFLQTDEDYRERLPFGKSRKSDNV